MLYAVIYNDWTYILYEMHWLTLFNSEKDQDIHLIVCVPQYLFAYPKAEAAALWKDSRLVEVLTQYKVAARLCVESWILLLSDQQLHADIQTKTFPTVK